MITKTINLHGEDGIAIYVTTDGDVTDELAPDECGVRVVGHRWYPCALEAAHKMIHDEYLARQ